MKEIHKNLFIGNDNDCLKCSRDPKFAVIHACKTCHQKNLGYTKSLSPQDPNYLIANFPGNIYFNLVDMPQEFQPRFTHPIFETAMKFIDANIYNKKVLIHCNQGMSRSASIGLVYLARIGVLPNKDYKSAANDYIKFYDQFCPGNGVLKYMINNWDYLMKIK